MELNAYYHMIKDPGMPGVTDLYKFKRWSDAITKYYDHLTPELKTRYEGYYKEMKNFIDNYKAHNKIY